tara:strand:- start:1228 stop:1530 length:303 start_codon:yes stop_codon:yes gene_type:complete
MKELEKYVGGHFSITWERECTYQKLPGRFCIFTIPTQRFYVESLSELTPERFELEIKKEKENQELSTKLMRMTYEFTKIKEVDKTINFQEYLDQNEDEKE